MCAAGLLAHVVYHVDVERDLVLVVIAALSVLVTLSAVFVALFGPDRQRRRRQPVLSLMFDCDWQTETLYLAVENDPNKDTAKDVELYVLEAHRPTDNYPVTPGGGGTVFSKVSRRLNWVDAGSGQVSKEDIPAGLTRRCSFLHLQTDQAPGYPRRFGQNVEHRDDQAFVNLGDEKMLLTTLPQSVDVGVFWDQWKTTESPARFLVALAGSNFPSTQYEVRVSFNPARGGMYEHEILAWFSPTISQSGPTVTLNFDS